MPKTDNHLDLVVVVSGVPRPIEANAHEPLRNVVREVLRESGDAGRAADDFELRSESGVLIDLASTSLDIGLKDGDTLFLNPRAGAGG